VLAANRWTSNLAGSEAASQSLPHTTRTSADPLADGEWIEACAVTISCGCGQAAGREDDGSASGWDDTES
jgi:hypothetical protein